MSDEQINEINLSELAGRIFRHKILLLILTLVIAISGTIALTLFSNSQKQYSSSFTIEYPASKEGNLPDGTKFNYMDIVSKSALLTTKEKDLAYQNIDVEKISKSNSISISRKIETLEEGKTEEVYTVSISAKYFDDDETAKSFMEDLINLPVQKIKNIVASTQHGALLDAYKSANDYDYENKLRYLSQQENYLLQAYEKDIEFFGNILVNGKTLSAHSLELENYIEIGAVNALNVEYLDKGYAPKDEALAKEYTLKKDLLDKEKTINEASITALRADLDAYTNSSVAQTQLYEQLFTKLTKLVERNVEITQASDRLNKQIAFASGATPINEAEYNNFKSNVEAQYVELKALTETYTNNVNSIYDKLTYISFSNSAIIVADGGFGLVVSSVISVIVGVIVGAVVCIIVDKSQTKKEETIE